MKLICLFGHNWQGCKCIKCGAFRDEDHDWKTNCELCSECGATRSEHHKWAGCKCTKCRSFRNQLHDWNTNCEMCSDCGATRSGHHKWTTNFGELSDEDTDWSRDCRYCILCGTGENKEHWWNDHDYDICDVCGRLKSLWLKRMLNISQTETLIEAFCNELKDQTVYKSWGSEISAAESLGILEWTPEEMYDKHLLYRYGGVVDDFPLNKIDLLAQLHGSVTDTQSKRQNLHKRFTAVLQLGNLGDLSTVQDIIAWAKRDWEVGYNDGLPVGNNGAYGIAARSLVKFGEPIIPVLLDLLNQNKLTEEIIIAVIAMRRFCDIRAVPMLLKLVRKDRINFSSELFHEAIYTLARIHTDEAISGLWELFLYYKKKEPDNGITYTLHEYYNLAKIYATSERRYLS